MRLALYPVLAVVLCATLAAFVPLWLAMPIAYTVTMWLAFGVDVVRAVL